MKAVLILDRMPKTCDKCPLSDENFDLDCRFFCLPEQKSVSKDKKPDWCPLKRFPTYGSYWYWKRHGKPQHDDFIEGWNACLNAIEEKEDG